MRCLQYFKLAILRHSNLCHVLQHPFFSLYLTGSYLTKDCVAIVCELEPCYKCSSENENKFLHSFMIANEKQIQKPSIRPQNIINKLYHTHTQIKTSALAGKFHAPNFLGMQMDIHKDLLKPYTINFI